MIFINKRLIFITMFIISISSSFAEIIGSDKYGYALDLPEGFVLTSSTNDNKGFQFFNAIYPVELLIRIYDSNEYDAAEKSLNKTLTKLSATAESSIVKWRYTDCFLSKFQLHLGEKLNEGWGLSVSLPDKKGFLVILAYTDFNNFNKNPLIESLILSTIDSICIDYGSFYCSGPITTFAYPSSERENIIIKIDDTLIKTSLDKNDYDAAEFVIEREFSVLTMFANTELWLDAWKRFYRQIYRDSYHRLKQCSFDIYAELITDAKKIDCKNPEKIIAKKLLSWVQNFEYERQTTNSDFISLPSIIAEKKGSDCDSRSLLLAILLRQMNMNTTIFVSPIYNHALLGIELDLPGAKITTKDKNYLLGETTAKVEIGLIEKNMSVTENWINIDFP